MKFFFCPCLEWKSTTGRWVPADADMTGKKGVHVHHYTKSAAEWGRKSFPSADEILDDLANLASRQQG